LIGELLESWKDGRVKMWTAMRTLRFRREHHEVFQQGSYEPLTTGDQREQHIVAFRRRWQDQSVIVAVPRFAYTLMNGEMRPPIGEVWGDSAVAMPELTGELENVLTGEKVQTQDSLALCRELFRSFPVAVLNVL